MAVGPKVSHDLEDGKSPLKQGSAKQALGLILRGCV